MKLKLLIFGFLLIYGIQNLQAQIGKTKEDIIKDLEYNYKSNTADDGTNYITYEKEFTTAQSGTYTRLKAIYFIENKEGTEICHFWKIIEPSSETNPWVSYFKKDFVEIEYMKWKDYENNIIYSLKVEDGICIVDVWYDFEKQ